MTLPVTLPMITIDHRLGSLAVTEAAARSLAPRLKVQDVIALHGDLGAGKTAFARALLRALTKNPALETPSPTFTLVQTYSLPQGEAWHFDWYRLTDEAELVELGWSEALLDAITLVEWAERFPKSLPSQTLHLTLRPVPDDPEARLLSAQGDADWMRRLQGWPGSA